MKILQKDTITRRFVITNDLHSHFHSHQSGSFGVEGLWSGKSDKILEFFYFTARSPDAQNLKTKLYIHTFLFRLPVGAIDAPDVPGN